MQERTSNGGTRTITLIMSAASVAIPLVGGAVAFMEQRISNAEKVQLSRQESAESALDAALARLDSLDATRLIAAHEDGVADTTRFNNVRDVAALQAESKALDDRLQREMRDLNAAIIAESKAVDYRLQGEIQNVNEHLLAHEAEAAAQFEQIEAVLSGRGERIVELDERIKALERMLFTVPNRSDP